MNLSVVQEAMQGRRVERSAPANIAIDVKNDDAEEVGAQAPDTGAGFAFIVAYVNAKGEHSHRRLSVKRIEGYGRADRLCAYCFETRMIKSFRIDRIVEIASIDTGELHDPISFFEELRMNGGMPMKDGAMFDLLTALVFIAECDENYHPLEHDAVEDALTSYVLRHGGDEASVAKAMNIARKIAPDCDDFYAALNRLVAHPDGKSIFRLIERSIGSVVEADGVVCPQEFEWALVVKSAIAELAG